MSEKPVLEYHAAGPTLAAFHASPAFVRLLIGPVGSAKSSACSVEILGRALAQRPGRDGVRRTRWVAVRNTYRELKDTTVATWLYWMGKLGKMNWQDMIFHAQVGDAEFDVLFRALDTIDDVNKVLSLEVTGFWLNEAREIPRGIWEAIEDRVGRFPPRVDGGATWRGIIADSNPPDQDHWFFKEFEENRLHEKYPEKFAYFRQPGGLIELPDGTFVENPQAENVENLEPHYYLTRMYGKPVDHVRVYYCAQYGFVREGKPVTPEYVDAVHASPSVIVPSRDLTVWIGLDFGLTPAAAFAQRFPNGQWAFVDELVTEDMGAVRFAETLKAKMSMEYQGFEFRVYGDPAGDTRAPTSQRDEDTYYSILRASGIPAVPTHSNDFVLRREALVAPMLRMVDGKPGLVLSPKAKYLRKGLSGGYHYRRVKVAGDERYEDKPVKNVYSHICEAAEYLLLGAGEGSALVRTPRRQQINIGVPSYSRRGGVVHGGRVHAR